jgi:hypothetical protein
VRASVVVLSVLTSSSTVRIALYLAKINYGRSSRFAQLRERSVQDFKNRILISLWKKQLNLQTLTIIRICMLFLGFCSQCPVRGLFLLWDAWNTGAALQWQKIDLLDWLVCSFIGISIMRKFDEAKKTSPWTIAFLTRLFTGCYNIY